MKKTTAPNGYRTVLVLNTFRRNSPVLVDADGRFDSDCKPAEKQSHFAIDVLIAEWVLKVIKS